MRKKIISLLLILSLTITVPVYSAKADNNSSTTNVTLKKQVDIGYFDVWKNSAGQWIPSDPPKYTKAYRPVLEDSPESSLCNPHILSYVISAPESIASSVVGVESISFITPNNAVNDYQDAISATTFNEYNNEYQKFQVRNIENINHDYLGNGKVSVQYNTRLEGWVVPLGEEQTKPWQNEIVSGHRFYMPILVTWKIQDVPDLKVWIDSPDKAGKQPGDYITINCSVRNLTDSLVTTDIGVAEYGLGWNPPTIFGPLIDKKVEGSNYNFSFVMQMPETTKTSVPPAV
ncbi:hypothetical protein [Syntrophomonas wolfei]|uniref:Uncharacterized protein n=1 Tax=Syntrophomonas wolfei subsp. wolfei (strain DSM 2245B / Goettingen) TaxID=335541 RepID=Q0AUM8_SYNWW|nr:hypothetical protein [Syntrophomonas wolfei]ABI69576.1 hypothetical protein Swol_2285 [Syntrophomonas wolfei subsp. wolfei str. Goettingen G311]